MQFTGIYTTLEFCTNHQSFEYGVDVHYVDDDGVEYVETVEDGRCETESEAWASLAQCLADYHKIDWFEG